MATTGQPDPEDRDGPDDDEIAMALPSDALTGPPPVPVEDDDEREIDTREPGYGG
jgi:hypothetical protein